jgi:hypothetical protein
MRSKIFLLTFAASIFLAARLEAQVEDFTFDITGDNADSGYVHGEIFGLSVTGTSQPTEIEITDAFQIGGPGQPLPPPAREPGAGIVFASIAEPATAVPSLPLIFTPDEFGAYGGTSVSDEFTVSDGAIVSGSLYAFDSSGQKILLNVSTSGGAFNGFSGLGGIVVGNTGGLGGSTYALAVPEPSSPWLTLTGLGFLVTARHFGKRRTTAI